MLTVKCNIRFTALAVVIDVFASKCILFEIFIIDAVRRLLNAVMFKIQFFITIGVKYMSNDCCFSGILFRISYVVSYVISCGVRQWYEKTAD